MCRSDIGNDARTLVPHTTDYIVQIQFEKKPVQNNFLFYFFEVNIDDESCTPVCVLLIHPTVILKI